jgi:hypothetical protein
MGNVCNIVARSRRDAQTFQIRKAPAKPVFVSYELDEDLGVSVSPW